MSVKNKLSAMTEAPGPEGKILNDFDKEAKSLRTKYFDKGTLKHFAENIKYLGLAMDELQNWTSSQAVAKGDADVAEELHMDAQGQLEMMLEETFTWLKKARAAHTQYSNRMDKLVSKWIDSLP